MQHWDSNMIENCIICLSDSGFVYSGEATAHTLIYPHGYTLAHTHIYSHSQIQPHTITHIHLLTHINKHIHSYIYAITHTHTQSHICVCTHTHTSTDLGRELLLATSQPLKWKAPPGKAPGTPCSLITLCLEFVQHKPRQTKLIAFGGSG